MKLSSLQPFGVQAHLAVARFGWGNSIAAILLLAAALSWLWLIPHLRAQLETRSQEIARAQQSLQTAERPATVPARPVAEERLAQFYENLGEHHYAEQQVKTLFAIAAKANLTLNQAEYRTTFDRNGGYQMYQILLPVKGPYADIRRFCEQTLLAIPFASLDEMSFKREAIASRTIEAKLRITLYLDAPAATQPVMATSQGEAR